MKSYGTNWKCSHLQRTEEWKGFEILECDKTEDVMITIMERKYQEVSRYIKERKGMPEKRRDTSEEAASSSTKRGDEEPMEVQWVQAVRNLSKTLVCAAEKEANVKFTSERTLYPWLARHACFLLNRFLVKGSKTPFEILFDREYKGALAPWGSTVLNRPLPRVKEKREPWKKGIFVGKDHVSNANLVLASTGIIKARTMRRCTPVFDIETMIGACGTPWNFTQKQVVTRKPRKRLPAHRGIEALPTPRSPSQIAGSDATPTGSYAPSANDGNDDDDDDDNDDEDPGEGTKGNKRSASSGSNDTGESEELMADDNGVPSPKRNIEQQASEPAATRQRSDEGSTTVQERAEKYHNASQVKRKHEHHWEPMKDSEEPSPEKKEEFSARIRRVASLKSVKEVEKFLKAEEVNYNDDEEIDLEEFEGPEADMENEEWLNDEEDPNEGEEVSQPTWSHTVQNRTQPYKTVHKRTQPYITSTKPYTTIEKRTQPYKTIQQLTKSGILSHNHIQIHIYTCMYTYIHMYIYTFVHFSSPLLSTVSGLSSIRLERFLCGRVSPPTPADRSLSVRVFYRETNSPGQINSFLSSPPQIWNTRNISVFKLGSNLMENSLILKEYSGPGQIIRELCSKIKQKLSNLGCLIFAK